MLTYVIGFLVVFCLIVLLMRWLIRLAVNTFYNAEERLVGRQFIYRTEDAVVNKTMVDGLAAFGPGRIHLVAGVTTGVAAILAVPAFHFLYAVWIRFIMLFGNPIDESNAIFGATMQTIINYMPRICINAVAFAVIGAYYAAKRRKFQMADRETHLLFWRLPTIEVFGTVLGWFLYFVAAMLPRFNNGDVFNFAGMLTLGSGWVWAFSGLLISMYLRAGENAFLWISYRYRWSDAIPAIVKMMAMRRLNIAPTTIQEVVLDEPGGAATIRAEVDAIDADRLRDCLLAVPGLHHPRVIALGPPPGSPVRIATELAPRMKPLPPRAFKRPEGPPKGYGAEVDLLAPAQNEETDKEASGRR